MKLGGQLVPSILLRFAQEMNRLEILIPTERVQSRGSSGVHGHGFWIMWTVKLSGPFDLWIVWWCSKNRTVLKLLTRVVKTIYGPTEHTYRYGLVCETWGYPSQWSPSRYSTIIVGCLIWISDSQKCPALCFLELLRERHGLLIPHSLAALQLYWIFILGPHGLFFARYVSLYVVLHDLTYVNEGSIFLGNQTTFRRLPGN